MGGMFRKSGEILSRIYRNWGIGIFALPVLIGIALAGLVLSRPDPSNLMPDVVQLAGAKTSPAAAPVCPIAGTGAGLSIFDPGAGAGVRLAVDDTANCPRASPSGIWGAFWGKVGVGLSDTRACSSAPSICDGFSLGGSTVFSPEARFGASAAGRIGAGGGVTGSAMRGG